MSRRKSTLAQVIAWVESSDKETLRGAEVNISAVIQRALKREADKIRSKHKGDK